jgi:hypothetical protein
MLFKKQFFPKKEYINNINQFNKKLEKYMELIEIMGILERKEAF